MAAPSIASRTTQSGSQSGRDEAEQERADIRHDDARDEGEPGDRAEGDERDDELLVGGDLPEEEVLAQPRSVVRALPANRPTSRRDPRGTPWVSGPDPQAPTGSALVAGRDATRSRGRRERADGRERAPRRGRRVVVGHPLAEQGDDAASSSAVGRAGGATCSSAASTRASPDRRRDRPRGRRDGRSLAGDGRRVPEPLGGLRDRLDDVARFARRVDASGWSARSARYASTVPGPGPEVLGRERPAARSRAGSR